MEYGFTDTDAHAAERYWDSVDYVTAEYPSAESVFDGIDNASLREMEPQLNLFYEAMKALFDRAKEVADESGEESHISMEELWPFTQNAIEAAARLLRVAQGDPFVVLEINKVLYGGTDYGSIDEARKRRKCRIEPELFWQHVAGLMAMMATPESDRRSFTKTQYVDEATGTTRQRLIPTLDHIRDEEVRERFDLGPRGQE